jgi:hypothetical protein
MARRQGRLSTVGWNELAEIWRVQESGLTSRTRLPLYPFYLPGVVIAAKCKGRILGLKLESATPCDKFEMTNCHMQITILR